MSIMIFTKNYFQMVFENNESNKINIRKCIYEIQYTLRERCSFSCQEFWLVLLTDYDKFDDRFLACHLWCVHYHENIKLKFSYPTKNNDQFYHYLETRFSFIKLLMHFILIIHWMWYKSSIWEHLHQ